MSDEFRDLQNLMRRMSGRRKQVQEAIAQLEKTKATLAQIIAEADTDIQATKLQLQAYKQSGDDEFKEQVKQ